MGAGCITTGVGCESLALAAVGTGNNTTGGSCESLALAAVGTGSNATGGNCESLALAAVGTGCNTTAWAAGTLTGVGLEAGAAAASRLGASPGKAALVARVPGCAVAAL